MHRYGQTQCETNLATYPSGGKTCGNRQNIFHLPQGKTEGQKGNLQ